MFYNREKEMKILNERLQSKKSELIVFYGRRRVGKTELIRHFFKNHSHIYFMADQRNTIEQLEIVSWLLAEHFQDEYISSNPIRNWEQFFTYLKSRNFSEKLVLIFDEFPYLVESSPELPSIIQRHWDNWLKKRNIFFILCGSSMSFMEKKVLSYKSPLYGRRTGQIELRPFNYINAAEMLGLKPSEKLIQFLGVFGNIPAYLELANPGKSIWQNIMEQIIPVDRFLHNEVRFLLMQELRTPQNYFAIMRAISRGKVKINEIVQSTQLDRGIVGKYLNNLIELRIIERRVPANENPLKSRKGIYVIKDNFFRFWFRFIYPYLTYIEDGRANIVMQKIKADFSTYLGNIFEEVCREFLKQNPDIIPFDYERIGAWWDRNEEIDILAYNKNGETLIGECKFSNKKVGVNILDNLKRKGKLIEGCNQEKSYILFSKCDFTDDMKTIAGKENVILVQLSDM